MPITKCSKCNQGVKADDKQIFCDCCRVTYHLNESCSELSASELRAVVLQKRTLMFLCPECRDAFKSAPMVIRRVKELQTEVDTLKKEIMELKNSQRTSDVEQILLEAHERSTRAYNLMIYDAPESSETSLQSKIDHDMKLTKDIFTKLGLQNECVAISKVIRVGQKGAGRKPRPLKAICNNTDIIKIALRSKQKLQSCAYKISQDNTKMQQAAYKAAREELFRRKEEGEEVVLRFIKGRPVVVPKIPDVQEN